MADQPMSNSSRRVAAPCQHFLFVTDPMQSHVASTRRLAERVAAAAPNARVTFSTAVSAHRVMFPHLKSPDGEVLHGVVSYIPYSDGFDAGFNPELHGANADAYWPRARAVGSETLRDVVERLTGRGRPVTRVVYTALVGWVAGVARARGMPAALFWAKPATVFAVYHRYFHGHAAELLLSGLPPLRRDALPSFASMASPGKRHHLTLAVLRDLFAALDDDDEDHGTVVLVDTFDELERDALRAVPRLDLVAVSPVAAWDEPPRRGLLLLPGEAKACIEWLDTKPARSVVYASFGSVLSVSKRQEEEMRRGLDATGRPYLLVAHGGGGGGERAMVVEWCDQRRVLSHPAVGCFVTHCRWDSTVESLAGGVPMVAVPRWADQTTVAALVEESAGVGVRARVDGEGVVSRGELLRCVGW
uniref:Glycosyltransferase n=1 Tax=Leersia perrieri TaxID=77586 RepID=A0A0D9WRQ0_9ORYZ